MRRLLVLCALVPALLLAACGGGDGGDTADDATTTTQDIAAATTLGEGASEPAPPSTPIPAVFAIPGQFGSLAPTLVVVGKPDTETGNRLSINLETPSLNTYVLSQLLGDRALLAAVGGYQLMIGNDKDFLCTRVSYKLDLHGPAMTIQTAC